MAEMANAVGKKGDAKKYRELFDRMKAAFNRAYMSEQGEIRDKTQTQYALALYCGLLNEDKIPLAVKCLVEDIRTKDHQVAAWGDAQGRNPMVPHEPDNGISSFQGLVARLEPIRTQRRGLRAAVRRHLSLLALSGQIGATSTWERWDSWTPEKGFQDPRMNSFHMPDLMASVGEWLFSSVAGIGQEGAGFKNILVKPYVSEGLTY